eukprot:CAMPEP_0185773328 /NCGR_PEP_ID=MMETSP1174-20130828/73000_1 /TAXON_ID=35687 /ORGANISM="Dictyocha speculum, Strain CCMP1381" /LENGTH=53 /DNA_ID=CAMNT_0028459965 /DNA_START=121 /DNA_END=279 /DNA_ORIENTATION=+
MPIGALLSAYIYNSEYVNLESELYEPSMGQTNASMLRNVDRSTTALHPRSIFA